MRASLLVLTVASAGCSGSRTSTSSSAVGDARGAPVPESGASEVTTLSKAGADMPTGKAPGHVRLETVPGVDVAFPMVYVPGGQFLLGSPETEPNRDEDEGPRPMVTISPFWIGQCEVTQEAFAVFRFRNLDNDSTRSPVSQFSADAVARPSPPYEDPAHGMGGRGYPAGGMTQWAALQFAKWLTDKTGRFYRLPTEAEWEYACRAGSSTAFYFGNEAADLSTYAWYWDNSDETFQPVGTRQPNAWGIYDMHGNVAEWTLDQYNPGFYEEIAAGAADPWFRPTRLHPRTVRGGAFDDDPEALRCANRLPSSMTWKRRDPQIPKSFWWNTDSPFVGFRLASPEEQPSPEEQAEFWRINLGE
jgi:formylglycine-generating enzyme required for sulfatase activity